MSAAPSESPLPQPRSGASSQRPVPTISSLMSRPTCLGGDAGPTPFGLLLCGLAACTPMTLRLYAGRNGWQLAAIQVNVVYNVADDGRTSIVRTITVPSELTDDQRAHLADVAERTPVTMAIRAGTPITTSIRAVETPTLRPTS